MPVSPPRSGKTPALPSNPSASPEDPRLLWVEVELLRGARAPPRRLQLPPGSTLRDVVRAVGELAEGCAVLCEGSPQPLDEPLVEGSHLVVVPTFSGG